MKVTTAITVVGVSACVTAAMIFAPPEVLQGAVAVAFGFIAVTWWLWF